MNRLRMLHEAGQSLRLDNITRAMLDDGGLRRYLDEWRGIERRMPGVSRP